MAKTTFNYNIKKTGKIQKIKQMFHAYMPLFLMILFFFSGEKILSVIIPIVYMGIVSYIYLLKAEKEGQNYSLFFSNTAFVAVILALHINAV